MITEEMLKVAAGELENAMLAEMPDPKAYYYEFSARFERKMKKLIYRVDHPFIANLGWRIAAVILAILLLGGSVLLISEDARAAFVGWISEKRADGSFHYTYHNDFQPKGVPAHFRLESVLEGYTLRKHREVGGGETFIYINDEYNKQIIFGFYIIRENSASTLGISSEGGAHKEALVNGRHADLIIEDKNRGVSHIVWTGYDGAVLFTIAGYLDEEALIYMAERVVAVEDTP